jgi:hypothetical protein
MKRKKSKCFGDMTLEEIERFEADSDSIVLFDANDDVTGINFQKRHDKDGAYLVIRIDGAKKSHVLYPCQIDNLSSYLNSHF